MPRDGMGNYNLPSGNPVVAGTTILDTWANNTAGDIAAALTASLTRDGQASATADISLGGHKLINLSDPVSAQDAVTLNKLNSTITNVNYSLLPNIFTYMTALQIADIQAGTKLLDHTSGLQAALTAIGVNGELVFPPGSYNFASSSIFNILQCAKMYFMSGALFSCTPGSHFILDSDIQGTGKIFDVGKTVTACDCNTAHTNLRTWNYQFTASDAGKNVTFTYGGAYTGSAAGTYPTNPAATIVQNRASFTTTITAFIDANNVTIAAAPTTPIRQDYVIPLSYANVCTGIVVIGNGTIEFTNKISSINVNWFGASPTVSDSAPYLQSAVYAATRIYGGAEIYFPDLTYNQSSDLRVDVQNTYFMGNSRSATLFRNNSIPLEQMNNITSVYRCRYGGGAPTKAAENWTNNGWPNNTAIWGGDWAIYSGLTLDNIIINGNSSNQPVLTPGTGLDNWDAGVDCLYTQHVLVKSTCKFINCLRWGVALSTLSDYGVCEDGVYFENCAEGGFYAEVSKYCHCGAINTLNCPAAGWNMGAITYLSMQDSTISKPRIKGGNNGIYIRQGCSGIDIDPGIIDGVANYGIWLYDESNGGSPLTDITITGGVSKNSQFDGIHAEYVNELTIIGVRGTANARYGTYIAHCTEMDLSHIGTKGVTQDILIDSGTATIQTTDNLANLKLQGTSTIHMTARVPSNKTFTDTSSGTGYLASEIITNIGDGKAIHKFGSGGINLSGITYLQPLYMGTYAFWVDSSGRYRIKNGTPSADTDGTAVGTLLSSVIYSSPLVIGTSYYWTEVATGKYRTKTVAAGIPSADNDGTVVGTQT